MIYTLFIHCMPNFICGILIEKSVSVVYPYFICSVGPVSSNLFEHLLVKCILQYIKSKNSLSCSQVVFRKTLSVFIVVINMRLLIIVSVNILNNSRQTSLDFNSLFYQIIHVELLLNLAFLLSF